jgi:hypothetical protein
VAGVGFVIFETDIVKLEGERYEALLKICVM